MKKVSWNYVILTIELEARRLAHQTIKDTLKAEGVRLSHVSSKQVDKAARLLLKTDRAIYGEAYLSVKKQVKTSYAKNA